MESPKFWFWPDHKIGKRESRRLREEHNKAVNLYYHLNYLLTNEPVEKSAEQEKNGS